MLLLCVYCCSREDEGRGETECSVSALLFYSTLCVINIAVTGRLYVSLLVFSFPLAIIPCVVLHKLQPW